MEPRASKIADVTEKCNGTGKPAIKFK